MRVQARLLLATAGCAQGLFTGRVRWAHSTAAHVASWLEDPTVELPKLYLKVPFAERDEAKALGARWDPAQKSWYVHEDGEEALARWKSLAADALPREGGADAQSEDARVYLNVSFEERTEARQLGARWDKERKKWFAPNGEEPLVSKFGTATAGDDRPRSPSSFQSQREPLSQNRFYLSVPFEKRAEAKAGGARWDNEARKWYVTDSASDLVRQFSE